MRNALPSRLPARRADARCIANVRPPSAPAERPAHVRAPHDEADFDAESEDAAARQARRERRSGDEEARESSGPETVVPEDVDMEALAGMAARAADDAAARMERLRREGLEGLGKDKRGEGK